LYPSAPRPPQRPLQLLASRDEDKNNPDATIFLETVNSLASDSPDYHCQSTPGAPGDADEATPGPNDELEIFVADAGKRTGILLVIPRSGKATATFGTVETGRKIDPNWKGQWQAAVQETGDGWGPLGTIGCL
jgi:hypothetical protein